MSREPGPGGLPPDLDDEEEPDPSGRIRTTGPGPVVVFFLVGLVLGWALRPLSLQWHGAAPTVGWLPALTLLLVAAILGAVARSTHRALHRDHQRLAPHHAVNRLVLAKSCALAGALVSGGYLGYALSWVGVTDTPLAVQRLQQSLAAGIAGALVVVGSLLLERACRVGGPHR